VLKQLVNLVRQVQELKWQRPIDINVQEMPKADIPLVAILQDWL